MKKIGIVTLVGNYNYGNRLQNYAVHRLLEEEGYRCETIVCYADKKRQSINKVGKTLLGILGEPKGKRYRKLDRFNRQLLHIREVYSDKKEIPAELAEEYAYFAVGSDQVWNPEIRKKERGNFFLRFARPEQRICVSPSIGVSKIDEEYESCYREGLAGFRYLCCREKAGADEISRISGKDCAHLIDPTLAISAEQWREIEIRDRCPDTPYVVLFFLGDVAPEIGEWVSAWAQAKGAKILEPSNPRDSYYAMDPREFVALIDGADLVLTDSFHAAAFSINMNTPFYVFDRHEKVSESNHMNSRIESMVQNFGLERCYVTDGIPVEGICDFSAANDKLVLERNKMKAFLKKSLAQQESMNSER